MQQTLHCSTPMSTKHTVDPCAQLANTRQEIAIWLKNPPPAMQADNANTSLSVPATNPNILAGLLLIAIAEQVLKRSAKLPIHTSAFPSFQEARRLLQASTRKYPWWMLGLAVIAGAGFAASRPWRWFAKKDTWVGLLSQLFITVATTAMEKKALQQEPSTDTHK